MLRRISTRTQTVALLAAVLVSASGCLNEIATAPQGPEDAPALPAPERLNFDYGFFDDHVVSERAAASKQNFFNAYIRAVVVQAITHFVLTPPVTAFSLALHTVPSPQDDGSYIWVYTWVDGPEEAQIRLRGLPVGNVVEWELRVTNLAEGIDNELWFDGETHREGETGYWEFTDFEREDKPVVARIDWGTDTAGNFLSFTDLDENPGDALEYREQGTLGSIIYTDADDASQSWFVKWNEADGSGSIQAPDHNDGVESCWDDRQNDVDCNAPVL